MKPRLLVIAGPTASGKTDLAIELARALDGELVCADSLTVYRKLDIGSAKPSPAQRAMARHHLIDIREPEDQFTAADFISEASTAIDDIISRGKRPIVVGGTGLYIRALLGGLAQAPGENPELRERLRRRAATEGGLALLEELRQVDPAAAERCHHNNITRLIRALEVWHTTGRSISSFQQGHRFGERRFDSLTICLQMPRELLYQRIEARVEAMISAGLVDEVRDLLSSGIPEDAKGLQAIGYREVTGFLRGETDIKTMSELIKQNTRHLAKRQLTWFRNETDVYHVAYPENSANIFSSGEQFFKEGEKPHVQDPLQHSGPIPESGPQGKSAGYCQDDVRRSY